MDTECKSGLVRVGGAQVRVGEALGEHWSECGSTGQGGGRTRLSPFCSVSTYVVSTRAIGPPMSISYTVDNNTLRLRVLSPEPDVMSLSVMRVTAGYLQKQIIPVSSCWDNSQLVEMAKGRDWWVDDTHHPLARMIHFAFIKAGIINIRSTDRALIDIAVPL